MNDNQNELTKALAKNGSFDAENAEAEATRARRWFESRLKWSARIAWMRLIIVIVVFEFALTSFFIAGSTRAMIGYAAMMVITMVLVGTIAVQSWVAGTKIRLLKELKLLRLECLGRPAGQIAPSDWKEVPTTSSMARALSVREYIAWLLALIVVAAASVLVTLTISANIWPRHMAQFEGEAVTIEAPHIGAPVHYSIYIRMEHGTCKVSRVSPDHKEMELFSMGNGFVNNDTLRPGDSLRLDPQGNQGEYSVRFE